MPDDDLDRGLPNRFAGHVYGLALGLLFGAPLGWLLKVPGPWLVFFVFLFAWVLGTFMRHIVTGVVEGTAKFIISFLWPSGGATPYERTYSAEQAMAARGDIDGAIKAYRIAMRQNPGDPEPRFRVAELLQQAALGGEIPSHFDFHRTAEILEFAFPSFMPAFNKNPREIVERDATAFFNLLLSGLAKTQSPVNL